MERGALREGGVVEASRGLVMIWVDCTKKGAYPALHTRYEIRGYPTIVIADAEGEELDALVGKSSAKVLRTAFEEHGNAQTP